MRNFVTSFIATTPLTLFPRRHQNTRWVLTGTSDGHTDWSNATSIGMLGMVLRYFLYISLYFFTDKVPLSNTGLCDASHNMLLRPPPRSYFWICELFFIQLNPILTTLPEVRTTGCPPNMSSQKLWCRYSLFILTLPQLTPLLSYPTAPPKQSKTHRIHARPWKNQR